MLLSLVGILPVKASTANTAFIVNVVGNTNVTYKSCSDGFPGTNHRNVNADNRAFGTGEMGIQSLTDNTGSVTISQDGQYQFELKGGGGAAGALDCAGGRVAMGGAGGHLIVNINLKKSDVVTYKVAAGGCKMSNGHSVAYDSYSADGVRGANGRTTEVSVNGTVVARAYGGNGGYRFCQQGDDWDWCDSLLRSENNHTRNGATGIPFPSDDPAVGGIGGSTWYSSKCSLVSSSKGANGISSVLPGLSNTVGQTGLTYQKWMQAAIGYSTSQTPGFFLMSLNHNHTWVEASGSCTEAGTVNRMCTECKGIAYGTVTKPAHGHNFKPINPGTDGYACVQGQTYFLSDSNSSSNKATAQWGAKENYWWTRECTYCHGVAKPVYAYQVRYVDKFSGNKLDPETKYENVSYKPYTQEQSGFKRTGYFIAYWRYSFNNSYYVSGSEDYPAGTKQQYVNLPSNGEYIVDLNAIWKPIPYTIRIHENYHGTDRTKDYICYYDKTFTLPKALWQHNAMVCGYSYNKDVKVKPEFTVGKQLKNLTTVPNGVIDLYTIWDEAPTVTLSRNELHIEMNLAKSLGIATSDQTLSRSQLESYILTFAMATDAEWEERKARGDSGFLGDIKPGEHSGYTFGVTNFETKMLEDQSTLVLYATIECTDDAGQTGQASMTIFFSEALVDILIPASQ